MDKITNKVQKYFNGVPKKWDTLYSHENRIMYILNNFLRKGLYERFALTFANCGEISGARVLDIGCGTGRYSIEFVARGAAQVVGIDISPAMVSFSKNKAKELGISDKCDFICEDFLRFQFRQQFDIVVALGFFDYVRNPEPFIEKISNLTERKFLATFPKDSLFWGTQRKLRYSLIKKCPIYFYKYNELYSLFNKARFKNYNICELDRGYFAIGSNL